MNATISGSVTGTRESSQLLAGLTVQAHNQTGVRSSAFLGETLTDRSGAYSIDYVITPSREPVRRQGNLFVRVFSRSGALLAESPVLFNASAEARIDVVLPAAGTSLAELDRNVAALTPYLARASLLESSDADLTFLTGASGVDRAQLEALRRADRIADEEELPRDLLYAAVREGLAPDDDGVFDPDAFGTAVERATRAGTIAAQARGSLERTVENLRRRKAAVVSRRLATYVAHLAVGRLLDDVTGEPLAGYTVQLFDLTGGRPAELGVDVSNEQGLFGVSYRLPPETPAAQTGRRLRLQVLDVEDAPIHTVEDIAVTGNPEDVFEIHVRLAAAARPDSPGFRQLGLELPPALADFLSAKNLETLADIRAVGGIALAQGLPVPADDPIVLALDAHADLDRVASDVEVSKALMAEGIDSVAKLAAAPRARVVALARGRIGDVKAYEMQVAAKTQAAIAGNAVTEYRLARASGRTLGSATTSAALGRVLPDQCGCEDCEAAVSPLAYLADLLNYALDHVELDGKPIKLPFLESTFLQPFAKLPADCEAVDERVRQVRLCIEVLRRYLAANNLPAAAQTRQALARAESSYRLDVYQALLVGLGTSYEDLRNARSASPESRKSLADRLGIAVAHLDELFLPVLARGQQQLTEAALEARFGLVDTTRDPLLQGPTPALQAWRQAHLRTLWHEQDWPIDAYADGTLPVIDPDLVGPDDFRAPYAKAGAADPDRPFDLWIQRRTAVDALLEALSTARQAQGIEAVVAQELGMSLAALATLLEHLGEGSEAERKAAEHSLGELHLTREALARLLEVADKAASQQDAEDAAALSEAASEVDAILVQVRKQRDLYSPWRQQEEGLGVRFDPRLFWPAVREPSEGQWPPALVASIPLIDPEHVERKQLPGPVAGELAHAIWASRLAQRAALEHALEQAHATLQGDTAPQTDALLRQALGDPEPGDPLSAGVDVDFLLEQLTSLDATVADAAEQTIAADLHMSVNAFKRLMEVRALADPAPEAWAEVYAILARAEKEKRRHPVWVAQEQSAGLRERYWLARKALLPRWRASHAARAAWRQALAVRCGRPLIDPDLIGPGELHAPVIGKAAFDLWQARREDFVVGGLASLEQEREAQASALAGFDAILLGSLYDLPSDLAQRHAQVQTARQIFGLSTTLTMVWGAAHADLDALLGALQDPSADVQQPARRTVIETLCVTPESFVMLMAIRAQDEATVSDLQWGELYAVLARAALLRGVVGLAELRARGEDVHPRLGQLGLPLDAFTMLGRMRGLLAGSAVLLAEEWDDVDAILLQLRKRRLFGAWRAQEQQGGLFLTPDVFKLPNKLPFTVPPIETPPLPRWRAASRDRRDWADRLQARIEQDRNVVDALRVMVSEAEQKMLPLLRDALIVAATAANQRADIAARAKFLADRLLIDTRGSGCATTTRIAQAIETMQGLLWSLRNRLLEDTYPALDLDDDDFDEAWQWIGSYATWRTAVFVFLYPENILAPQLRRHQTPAFRELVRDLRDDRRLTPDRALAYARRYSDYFNDVIDLEAVASCQTRVRVYEDGVAKHYAYKLFVFARGGKTGKPYWCAYDPEDESGYAQSFWTQIPGFANVSKLIGAVPYQLAEDTRHIYLFAQTEEKGQRKLALVRFDLELNSWEGEATELELLDDEGDFDALVTQRRREDVRPEIVLRLGDGAIFIRSLGQDGGDWEDADWRMILGAARGHDFALCAYIEVDDRNECLIVSGPDETVLYRVYGSLDDGRWRHVAPTGSFLGAYGMQGTFVVLVEVTGGYKRMVRIRPREEFTDHSVSSEWELHDWLLDAAGASLKATRFPAGYTFPFVVSVEGATVTFDIGLGSQALYDTLRMTATLTYGGLPSFLHKAVSETVRQHSIDWLWARVHEQGGSSTDMDFGPWEKAQLYIKRMATSILEPPALRSALEHTFVTDTTLTFRQRPESEAESASLAPAATTRLASSSGWIPTETKRLFVLQRADSHRGMYRCRIATKLMSNLLGVSSITPLALRSVPTFGFSPDLTELHLQTRRQKCEDAFAVNKGAPAALRTCLEEALYGVPMLLAAALSARGHYTGALDWYRTVYDYSQPAPKRVIYTPLDALRGRLPFDRADDWLLDPLDPHAIAANRAGVHKRFTLLSICGCLLDYADAEFSRDTAESVPRARLLYGAALELLESPELKQQLKHCAEIIGTLDITVGDPYWVAAVEGVKAQLAAIGDAAVLEQTLPQISAALSTDQPWAARIASARAIVTSALSAQISKSSLGLALTDGARRNVSASRVLDTDLEVASAGARAAANSVRGAREALSLISGVRSDAMDTIEMPALRAKRGTRHDADSGTPGRTVDPAIQRADVVGLSRYNPLAPSRTAVLAKLAQADPIAAVKTITGRRGGSFVPAPSFAFCIPPNPVIKALRLRAELNLYKIRSCRNIAGMLRELEPYAAPTDTVSGLPTIGAGGQLVLPGLSVLKPTPYRYPVLVERAKQLAGLAQQVEAAMLSAIEKGDAERYSELKARQDVQMATSGVRLQTLRVREAEGAIKLAELQQERAQIQRDTFQAWLDDSGSVWESLQIGYLIASVAQFSIAAAKELGSLAFANAAKLTAEAAAALGQIQGIYAARERQEKEWELQRNLADQDIRIGAQGVRIAEDHVRVVEQERVIAELQLDHAKDVVEFLVNKFTNVELYSWMSDVLEGVYSGFLQQATATAQLAASQLAFERQEATPPMIQADYWEAPADYFGAGADGKAPDRRGLTGSARLLQDIHQLDQYAFDTDQRKLQLAKTISLAQLAPAEFQRFRETGVVIFATPMAMFDRDFPGHYLRLIKRIRTSVIALIPPAQGVRATLATTGTSRVVIGGDLFQTVLVNHGPQSVALSLPTNATGLFELDTQPEMLLPFEGLGVDTTWEFKLPKPANLFDYGTIADVLVTIEYTALNSYDYRSLVIQELDDKVSADRAFSFRHQFADQWFDLHNPEQTATPMVVRFRTRREDFPPNLEDLKVQHVVLYFARAGNAAFEVPVTYLRFAEDGESAPVGGGATTIDGIVSTRKGNAASWTAMVGKAPFGDWELALLTPLLDGRKASELFAGEQIDDILLVITYSSRLPEWPQ